MTIILLCMWALILAISSMMGEASTTIVFVVKMMDNSIEQNQEDCEATNDNQ